MVLSCVSCFLSAAACLSPSRFSIVSKVADYFVSYVLYSAKMRWPFAGFLLQQQQYPCIVNSNKASVYVYWWPINLSLSGSIFLTPANIITTSMYMKKKRMRKENGTNTAHSTASN